MKKSIIASLAAAAVVFTSLTALAANPKVVLNNRVIDFEDQPAVISDEGRTLVPVRGVFENMGARVDWFESDRSIAVFTSDNLTKIILKIDDKTMKVRHFTDILNYTEEQFTLDTAPTIINDRTLIPLRAISEAMGCDVKWDDELYSVIINTNKQTAGTPDGSQAGTSQTAPSADTRLKLSLSADKEDVKAGDIVNVTVTAENVKNDGALLNAVTARVFYDSTKFEFVDCDTSIYKTEKQLLGAKNGAFNNNSVKASYILADSDIKFENGPVLKFQFKALSDEGGEFSLSNGISTKVGSDTSIIYKSKEGNRVSFEDDDVLNIVTTPITVK